MYSFVKPIAVNTVDFFNQVCRYCYARDVCHVIDIFVAVVVMKFLFVPVFVLLLIYLFLLLLLL